MADKKITELVENTTPLGTDLLLIIDDPAGTPSSQKLKISNLLTLAISNIATQVFTSGGTYTPTTGMKKALIFCVGGGGGSGDCTLTDAASGGGGGGGAAIELVSAADVGVSQSVTIGAGGTAGDPGAGGGTTSVGSLVSATGGGGTAQGTAASNAGGTAGQGSGGNVNLSGTVGQPGLVESGTIGEGGDGGASAMYWGPPSYHVGNDTPGVAGILYGGGAAGAHAVSATDRLGAEGAAGIVFIIEFIG